MSCLGRSQERDKQVDCKKNGLSQEIIPDITARALFRFRIVFGGVPVVGIIIAAGCFINGVDLVVQPCHHGSINKVAGIAAAHGCDHQLVGSIVGSEDLGIVKQAVPVLRKKAVPDLFIPVDRFSDRRMKTDQAHGIRLCPH